MTLNIQCSGPGPHTPANGILGQSDVTPTGAFYCSAAPCQAIPQAAAVLAATAAANQATIQQQAAAALTNNVAYLAIGSPTNAQVVAQVAAMTRQLDALIRLALGKFDATS